MTIRFFTPEEQQSILQTQQNQQNLSQVREENPALSAMFPRMAQRSAEGQEGFGGNIAAAGADILSGAGRTAMAYGGLLGNLSLKAGEALGMLEKGEAPNFEQIGRDFLNEMQTPEGKGLIGSIVKDPRTAVGLGMGGALLGMAKTGLKGASMAGGIEGLTTGLTGQMANIGEGKDISAGEFAMDVGLSTALPGVAAGLKKYVAPAFTKVINPAVTRLASELSGISTEALNVASSKIGRQKIVEMAGKSKEIGDRLLNSLENIDDNFHFESDLQNALSIMPKIKTQPLVESITESIKKLESGLQTKPKQAAAQYLKTELKAFKRLPKELDASDYRNMRKDLDYSINFDEVGSDLISTALADTRRTAKQSLLDASKGTDYEPVMKKYSDVLDKREKIYNIIGKKPHIREGRIEGFLSNLYGKNKTARQELLKDLDDVLGENFTKDAKLATLANEIVKDGNKIPFFPVQTTGRSLMGSLGSAAAIGTGVATANPALIAAGLGSAAVSSPKMVTYGLQGLNTAPNIASDILNNPILQRTIPGLARIPIQQKMGNK
jgi:hypothetical protein